MTRSDRSFRKAIHGIMDMANESGVGGRNGVVYAALEAIAEWHDDLLEYLTESLGAASEESNEREALQQAIIYLNKRLK